jgi:excisionase family DNA binding protein
MDLELLHTELQQLRLKVQNQDEKFDQFMHLVQRIAEELGAKQFYTIQEFAQLTGLKRTTITNYCMEGILKATQVTDGGKWMIYRTEVDRLKKQAQENHFNERKCTTNRDNILRKAL